MNQIQSAWRPVWLPACLMSEMGWSRYQKHHSVWMKTNNSNDKYLCYVCCSQAIMCMRLLWVFLYEWLIILSLAICQKFQFQCGCFMKIHHSKCHCTWESCEETCACSIENGMIVGRGYFFHASTSRSTVKV